MRIVSLIPSATEIAFALGLDDEIVGVTHECDYPPEAELKPRLTTTTLDRSLPSAELDAATTGHLLDGSTSYVLDERRLAELEPDLILTQMLCEVCAVPHGLVQGALPRMKRRPRVVSLEPAGLADVLSNIKTVGDHTGRSREARNLIANLRTRIDQVALRAATEPPKRVLCLEWVDPLWCSGHWVPDMVGLAGGIEVLGEARRPSRRVTWDEVIRAAPEVIVLTLCGFDLNRSVEEFHRTHWPAEALGIPALRDGRVYAIDGSAYVTRPGPRLVRGIEILGDLLRIPDAVPAHLAQRLALL